MLWEVFDREIGYGGCGRDCWGGRGRGCWLGGLLSGVLGGF